MTCENARNNALDIMPYLLTLADRNDPICVAPPKVAKASTIVTVPCRSHQLFHLKNIANVHEPIRLMYTHTICV
jgi:hypothetical protein